MRSPCPTVYCAIERGQREELELPVAVGLARVRRWSRTPALLTQLFTGIIGIYLVQGHRYWLGVPGLALAVAGYPHRLMNKRG
jgi:hypothetical protein